MLPPCTVSPGEAQPVWGMPRRKMGRCGLTHGDRTTRSGFAFHLEKALCLGLRKRSSKSAGTQKEMGISLTASINEKTECVQQLGHLRTVLRLSEIWGSQVTSSG